SLGLTICSEYLLYNHMSYMCSITTSLSATAPLSLFPPFQSCPHCTSDYRPHVPIGRDARSMPSVA
ncbi:hypothetical protein ASPFODRAFT_130446, partial [Aspergillus luchuensis CBS 106.47]